MNNIQALQNTLHTKIPLTKFMDVQIESYDEKYFITNAPLEPNINDKGTAFGGSLSTIMIISSWSLCNLITKEFGYESENIVILNNNTNFTAPVTKDFKCITNKPSKEQLEILYQKIKSKGSGSIKIESSIVEDGKVCADFEGVYVIKL